jgi:hypothetical protein
MASKVDTPIYRDSPETRAARRWQYLVVLLQEAGIDPKKVPSGQMMYALMAPYERAGHTSQDIENWINSCDPEVKPSWDEVTCFRTQVRAALRPHPSLGTHVALVGGVAFAAAFLLTRAIR